MTAKFKIDFRLFAISEAGPDEDEERRRLGHDAKRWGGRGEPGARLGLAEPRPATEFSSFGICRLDGRLKAAHRKE
jgi:hypothetical protein